MSKIALTPNASGTGTFTLAAPNSNTSRTITLPDEAGEVLVNGTTQNVGIGTSSPQGKLEVSGDVYINGGSKSADAALVIQAGAAGTDGVTLDTSYYGGGYGPLKLKTGGTERMRIDSSGNLLVGQSSSTQPGVGNTTTGFGIRNDGLFFASAYNGRTGTFSRSGTDGPILGFYKDGSSVGSIAVTGTEDLTLYSTATGHKGLRLGQGYYIPTRNDGAPEDNTVDIGLTAYRYNDIYATNGTIQTSDRNEKQDIEVLSEAETRVAQACKGLLRKFRWKDAVAEKGDDARIHFGIIAQDLQDAFAAEGLDAGRYAMFISSTWWETQTEVPAVEAVDAVYEDVVIPAVLDEEGNELEAERTEQQLVTEAVEAKEAYTRTDTYETQAEAPEGATERTRLGVRYPELLAVIIGAK